MIKKIRILFLVILGLVLLTGCQPTPEDIIVANKGNNNLENIINQTPAPEEEYDVPETWTSTFQKEGSKLIMNVDATITIPNVKEYPVVRISPDKFTQEQVDNMVKILFNGESVYNGSVPLTKSELEDRLVIAKGELANKKTNPESNESSIGDLEEIITELEKEIIAAPEVVDNSEVSTLMQINDNGEIRLDLIADLGKKQNATLTIMNKQNANPYTCFAHFVNTDSNSTYNSFDDWNLPKDTPVSLDINEEDAIKQAKNLLNELNITNVEAAAIFPGIIGGTEGSDVSGNPQCYMIYFTRTVEGIPTTFGSMQSSTASGLNPANSDDYKPTWDIEQILVCVDDTGIVEFEWNSPAKIIDEATENVSLLSFDKIKGFFEEQMFVNYSYIEDDEMLDNRTYHIERITLGLSRIAVKDNLDEYMLVPVWNFFGSVQDNFNMDVVIQQMKKIDPVSVEENKQWYEQQNGKLVSNGFRSFLSINAIDGSIVN